MDNRIMSVAEYEQRYLAQPQPFQARALPHGYPYRTLQGPPAFTSAPEYLSNSDTHTAVSSHIPVHPINYTTRSPAPTMPGTAGPRTAPRPPTAPTSLPTPHVQTNPVAVGSAVFYQNQPSRPHHAIASSSYQLSSNYYGISPGLGHQVHPPSSSLSTQPTLIHHQNYDASPLVFPRDSLNHPQHSSRNHLVSPRLRSHEHTQAQNSASFPPTSSGELLTDEFHDPFSDTLNDSNRTSRSNRYKTELCRAFTEQGVCKYNDKCQYAHGEADLRTISRHAKYKTQLCRTFHTHGICPYGKRCHFIHSTVEPSGNESTQVSSNDSSKNKSHAHHDRRGGTSLRTTSVSTFDTRELYEALLAPTVASTTISSSTNNDWQAVPAWLSATPSAWDYSSNSEQLLHLLPGSLSAELAIQRSNNYQEASAVEWMCP